MEEELEVAFGDMIPQEESKQVPEDSSKGKPISATLLTSNTFQGSQEQFKFIDERMKSAKRNAEGLKETLQMIRSYGLGTEENVVSGGDQTGKDMTSLHGLGWRSETSAGGVELSCRRISSR